MKKLLPALLILIAFKSNSQSLVLTQAANEPIVGDTSWTHPMDTSAFSSAMPTGVTGTNVVWNFTALNTQSLLISSAYVTPTAVASASAYSGCTMVQKQGTLYSYYKSVTSPTTQTEFMGISSSSLNMNFSNTAIAAKYPMTFGSTINDNFSGSFSFSVSGNVTGNVNTIADGTGTLNLPLGLTYTNVLRVKSVQNMTMTSGPFPVATVKQTSYYFYDASEKFPILTLNYTSMALTGQSPTVTAGAAGNADVVLVGLKEQSLLNSQLAVYPNPVSDHLNFDLSNGFNAKEIKIYTQLGQCIYCNVYENSLNVSELSAGIYFVEIKGEKGTVRKKFIKE
jgi:hypothetical protein